MFAQILWTQVKWTRTMVVAFTLIVFVLPAAAWNLTASGSFNPTVSAFISSGEVIGVFATFVALVMGFLVAVYPWTQDGAAKHVYPLSLPITWPRYVFYRFVAGTILLVLPAIGLLLGCLLALSLVSLPPVLHAYPISFTFRFVVASLLAYGISFALQYLGGRRAALVLLAGFGGILIGGLALDLAGLGSLRTVIGNLLFEWPGPFAVFVEDWKFIDV